jgi:hypothetical protein
MNGRKEMPARRLLIALALTAMTSGSVGAHAQTQATTVTYSTGWTMLGGPPDTDFSSLAPLYAWASSGYFNPSSTKAALCQGYWSLVAVQTTVTLASPPIGNTQDCALQTGWNLIGDPFLVPALLPPGVTALTINKNTGNYMQAPAIPAGGAAWIFAGVAATVTLQAAATSRTPEILSISLVPSGPYTVHVGDGVQLFMPSIPFYNATADPMLLPLDQVGLVSTLSCIGEPACSFTTTRRFWSWHAAATGKAFINVAPVCPDGKQTCGVVASIEVDIQS